jgi:hypothetical protein
MSCGVLWKHVEKAWNSLTRVIGDLTVSIIVGVVALSIELQLTPRAVNSSRKGIAPNQTRLSKGDRTCESSVFTETHNNSKCGTIIKYPYRINDSVLGGEL